MADHKSPKAKRGGSVVASSTLTVEYWPIDRPKPYAKNPRKRSRSAVAKLASSIKEFGFRQPIVVDEKDVILVGHTRLDAAIFLELKQVPVHVALGLSEAQKRAYRIADNRTNEETGWDDDLLKFELGGLREMNFDLSLTGFNLSAVNGYLRGGARDGEDNIPVKVKAITKLGDLWALGEHRLLCGDSTNPDNVKRLLGDDVPGLMVTDPPYGVDYNPQWRLDAGVNKSWQKRAEGLVTNDDRADWTAAWALFTGSVAYVWHGALHAREVAESLESQKLVIRSQIIWAKPSLVMGRGNYHWQHEPCWYAVRSGATASWQGDRKQSTLWTVANMHRTQGQVDDGKNDHSTQKPVELMRRPMMNHTAPGDFVYDPFLGSGTTLIAAETEGRRCLGLELSPTYCDLIVARWEKITSKKAERQRGA